MKTIMANQRDIHCLHLEGQDWTEKEVRFLATQHESKGCPTARAVWIEKTGSGYSYIEGYPDPMDSEDAHSLQEVCMAIWAD